MIYVAMGMWLFLILLTGMGVYRMWTKHLGGAVADWILLPATVMSELAYSAGRLITGRPAYGGIISPQNPSADACRTAISGKGGFPVAMLSSFLVLVVCGVTLGVLGKWMGDGAIGAFVSPDWIFESNLLPGTIPTGWDAFWNTVTYQVELLRRFCEGWTRLDWGNWPSPVFVYLSICFSVRLGPVRHDWRPTLVVTAMLLLLLAGAATLIEPLRDVVNGWLWRLLTYTWGLLLFLLVVTLIVLGIVHLARAAIGKRKPAA